jgi:hypothetical protein
MKNSANKPIVLHPEQETTQKYAFERLENEPARWFLRFRAFCLLGHKRTLQAVAEQELSEKRQKKVQSDDRQTTEEISIPDKPVKVSISGRVPGAWSRAAKQWQWKNRAAAYDEFMRLERHKEVLSYLDHECDYITKAQRLDALATLMKNLMRITLETEVTTQNYNTWLAMHRQALATLREIRREMKELDTLDGRSFSELSERLL